MFVDSNVWLPAGLSEGFSRNLVTEAQLHFRIVVTRELVSEVANKLALKFRVSFEHIRAVTGWMLSVCLTLELPTTPAGLCRDPDDDVWLGQAMAAGCQYFVTNDGDLLAVGAAGSMDIIAPAEFARILGLN